MNRTTLTAEQRTAALDLVDRFQAIADVANAVITGRVMPNIDLATSILLLANAVHRKARIVEALAS